MHHQIYPQVHPLIALSSGSSTRYLFLYNFVHCSQKWNLRGTQVQHRVTPHIHLFIESFCALLSPDKCITMRIFKCNSIGTSIAPLISTFNVPFCASLYRSQNTPLSIPWDEPTVASSIALTNAPSSATWSAMSNGSFLSTSYASFMAL